jgi:hypothetical protein
MPRCAAVTVLTLKGYHFFFQFEAPGCPPSDGFGYLEIARESDLYLDSSDGNLLEQAST